MKVFQPRQSIVINGSCFPVASEDSSIILYHHIGHGTICFPFSNVIARIGRIEIFKKLFILQPEIRLWLYQALILHSDNKSLTWLISCTRQNSVSSCNRTIRNVNLTALSSWFNSLDNEVIMQSGTLRFMLMVIAFANELLVTNFDDG